jgi:hypothetical protein
MSIKKHIEENGLEDCVFNCLYKFKDDDEQTPACYALVTIGGNGLSEDWEDDLNAVEFDEKCVYHFEDQAEFLAHGSDDNCDIKIIELEKVV